MSAQQAIQILESITEEALALEPDSVLYELAIKAEWAMNHAWETLNDRPRQIPPPPEISNHD